MVVPFPTCLYRIHGLPRQRRHLAAGETREATRVICRRRSEFSICSLRLLSGRRAGTSPRQFGLIRAAVAGRYIPEDDRKFLPHRWLRFRSRCASAAGPGSGRVCQTLSCGEDLDLWLKLARLSHVDYVPAPLVGLRVHPGNTCSRAVRANPELVLFQWLRIWNKWWDQIADRNSVLDGLRREAVVVGMANLLRRNPELGLYGRLRRSNLALAESLFCGVRDYLQIKLRIRLAY